MSRSLFRRLHRLLGPRASGLERIQSAQTHRERIAKALPIDLALKALPTDGEPRLHVGVIGGGFAGLLAALALKHMNFKVSLFEARDAVGGRVDTLYNFVAGRTLEKGAELIGTNHPLWICLAQEFGLGLSLITDEDHYVAARLQPPVRFDGRRLSPSEVKKLYDEMARMLADLAKRSRAVHDSYNPWLTPDAEKIDSISLESWIHGATTNPLLRAALEFEFANDNAVATCFQSLLAVLTQIAGGGGEAFWTDTEVFRCENGNAALAAGLFGAIATAPNPATVHLAEAVSEMHIDGPKVYLVSASTNSSRQTLTTAVDFVIVAVPASVLSSISLDHRPFPIGRIQTGPAVKYLAETKVRYWLRQGDAPSGTDSGLGMLWEGTDNQMGSQSIDLTVFAGGPLAADASAGSPDSYFAPKIDTLLPGFSGTGGKVKSFFANWPSEKFIQTGYSCPAPKQVVTLLRWMQQPVAQRIFLAGEHVSPPFFGYMEGALQSGLAAACRVGKEAKVTLPASFGSFSMPGVQVQL